MQCTLGLGCFLFGVIANESGALGQAKMEGQQRPMLHADGPQGGAINLWKDAKWTPVNLRWRQTPRSNRCSPSLLSLPVG